jgi:hypothetical protein
MSQIIIGNDGYPAMMVVPDPRAYALQKLWLHQQPDRDPIKRQRDQAQGIAVGKAVMQYLPGFQFHERELKMFPKCVVADAFAALHDPDRPAGI